jgi:anti-sigma factor RsiW
MTVLPLPSRSSLDALHPSGLTLELYAAEDLPCVEARAEVAHHLQSCHACQQRLARIEEDNQRFATRPELQAELTALIAAAQSGAEPPAVGDELHDVRRRRSLRVVPARSAPSRACADHAPSREPPSPGAAERRGGAGARRWRPRR